MIANQQVLFKEEFVPPKSLKTHFAYSIKTVRVKEPNFPYHGRELTCTTEVLEFARSLQNSDIEKMLTLYLDAQNKLICIQINSGTVNQCIVFPREILRHALLVGACAVILVHNHPSGNPKPSEADKGITKSLQEAGKIFDIKIHDHLIVGETRFFSFREEGLVLPC